MISYFVLSSFSNPAEVIVKVIWSFAGSLSGGGNMFVLGYARIMGDGCE